MGPLASVENWLPVVGSKGLYEVSDLGRVRSLDRVQTYQRLDQYSGRVLTIERHRRGVMLRPGEKPSGHVSVVLGRRLGSKDVHFLVLTAFAGPCPVGMECLHDNDIASDNRLANLRWGTRSENVLDAIRNGGRKIGSGAVNAKLTEADIPEIRARLSAGASSEVVARDYGVSGGTIRQVTRGRTWGHVQ